MWTRFFSSQVRIVRIKQFALENKYVRCEEYMKFMIWTADWKNFQWMIVVLLEQ